MKLINIVFIAIILSLEGCAPNNTLVKLDSPNPSYEKSKSVVVNDGRLDKQVYMTGISIGAKANIYMIKPEPALHVALEQHIYSNLSKRPPAKASPNIEVTIEDLDLKTKVGFGTANELLCKIESTVTIYRENSTKTDARVKTFFINDKDMSVLISTIAKETLDPCLIKHAEEISAQIK